MKEKIVSLLMNPIFVFSGVAIRFIMFGASIGDAIAIIAFCGLYGFYLHLDRKSKIVNNTVYKEINELKNAVASLKIQGSMRKTFDGKDKEKPTRYF